MESNDKYIGQRCLKLAGYGFLQNLGDGIYTITDADARYLDGELDANRLETET